jgi:NAD dependent epimerase/dehydratase
MGFQSGFAGKTVCVTGAGGFIGSHLTEALLREGARVRALVEYSSTQDIGWLSDIADPEHPDLEIIPGDVRDTEQMATLVDGCELVFHLAALIAIPYSYRAARSYVDTNITGSLNVLQACRDNSTLERLIMTSTSEVYGTAQFVPITEAHPLTAQSPYAATKIAADQLAESFYRSYDLPVTILRPFNTYGPRQSMRAVIPTIIRQALESDRLTLGNLTPRRDFNYVGDTIQGFLKVALASDNVCGQVIQVGSGRDISIKELVTVIESLLGKTLYVKEADERYRPEKSEVFRLCAAIEKAQSLIGYQPEVSFEDGLKATIDWFAARQPKPYERVATYHV